MSDAGAEFRFDTLNGEWVVIAGSRQNRPNRPATDCPFGVGGVEAPEPYDGKAFPNRWPMYVPGDPVVLDPASGRGQARGASEVVLYSANHETTLATMDIESRSSRRRPLGRAHGGAARAARD